MTEPSDASTGEAKRHPVENSDELDSAAVFSLLGDETRLEIIVTLSEEPTRAIPFSELHESVDISDSGQFNYHLSQLVDQFVAKTADGYELTSAGQRIARAVAAGFYTDTPELDPFEVDGPCIHCGTATVRASYSDERFHIECGECEESILRVPAPPSIVRGRTPQEAIEAFERWSSSRVDLAHSDEMCPFCAGPIERTVTTDGPESSPVDILPKLECQVCNSSVETPFAAIAVNDPVVAAFQKRNGLLGGNQPYWSSTLFLTDTHLEVLSEDPWRIALTIPAEEECCRVILNDSHEIIRTEIEPSSETGSPGES